MTDGRLNHLLDVLRAQQLLPKADYEMITSYPTLTVRTRALIDTCLSLGEQAAETVVTVLSSSKGSLLLRRLQTNPQEVRQLVHLLEQIIPLVLRT
uniref:CARD domain-containing protein n=1 Tax=Laticauda laticaudata TaxID=8630 RepID=A0A8C5RCT0_LATLA